MISDTTLVNFTVQPACATAEIDTAKPSLEGRAVGASNVGGSPPKKTSKMTEFGFSWDQVLFALTDF